MTMFSSSELKEDEMYYEHLDSDIWLVDIHRWAYYIWEKERIEKKIDKCSLVHVDYHWDGGNDFHNYPDKEKELHEADLDKIYNLVAEGSWIRFDSFISPSIIRGFISEVHFYCVQDDDHDVAIDADLLNRMGTSQYIHSHASELSNIKNKFPLIFDFCLDIFNKSNKWYQGDIWDDKEIFELLELCKPLVKKSRDCYCIFIVWLFRFSRRYSKISRNYYSIISALEEVIANSSYESKTNIETPR